MLTLMDWFCGAGGSSQGAHAVPGVEVTRAANSALYGAAWRAAKALGYTRLITYTQAGESGASLRGAGWKVVAERRPHQGWDRPSRPRRVTGTEGIPRTLWEATA